MPFRIRALNKQQFAHLFPLASKQLASFRALRLTARSQPGFPCRVSLQDAEIGEEVLLVHFEHLSVDTPFRASHAVYIRPSAEQAYPSIGEVPAMLRTRILSLRAFDGAGMMIDADLAEGTALEPAIETLFGRLETSYIHLHFAKPGCFAARVDRA